MESVSKRKRTEGHSSDRDNHPTKSTRVANDSLLKLERLVAKLCKSAGVSTNTKKEIREVSSALRSHVARMVSEQEEEISSRESAASEEGVIKPIEMVTFSTQTDEICKDVEENLAKSGVKELRDASTQTEAHQKSTVLKIDGIHDILKNEGDQEKLLQTMINNWPGGVYTNTETKKEDILDEVSYKNSIVIIEIPPEAGEEETVEQSFSPRIQSLIKNQQIKSGDIMQVRFSTTLITEGTALQEHEISTYVIGIKISDDKKTLTEETLRSLKKLFENIPLNNSRTTEECPYLFGKTSKKLETPTRKVLEYFGHKTDTKFKMYVGSKVRSKIEKSSQKNTNNARSEQKKISPEEKTTVVKTDWKEQRRRKPRV